MAKKGLYANIHAKRKRIAAGSKEKMRKNSNTTTSVLQYVLCNVLCSIHIVECVSCNPCCAAYVMQHIWCSLCGTICVVQHV